MARPVDRVGRVTYADKEIACPRPDRIEDVDRLDADLIHLVCYARCPAKKKVHNTRWQDHIAWAIRRAKYEIDREALAGLLCEKLREGVEEERRRA